MTTHAEQVIAFTKRTCREAGKAGLKLKLEMETPDGGWKWKWSNGIAGSTSAQPKAVALFMACEDLAMPAQSTTYSFTV